MTCLTLRIPVRNPIIADPRPRRPKNSSSIRHPWGQLIAKMKAFPKDVAMRWAKIVATMPGKSKAACMKRVAELKKKSSVITDGVLETYAKEIEVLKEKVRNTILAAGSKQVEKMCLIDAIQRLGVSNHFEKEIDVQLEQIFVGESADTDHDLYTIALHFRLCRQHGYNLSCNTFDKFKDNTGKFKPSVASDPGGMLALYEASQLRVKGENILDEALEFTATHLESFELDSNPNLANQVKHALYQQLRKGAPRVEARHFISVYEDDKSKNESLLKLAKLDFNFLQLLHKKELCEVSRWWKDLDFVSKLPYARDRIVECYFWTLGLYVEPRYSLARIMFAKTVAMISVIDDTYDAYGIIEELQVFTELVERWDIRIINQLPEYMKPLYTALLGLYEEFEDEMTKQGKSYAAYYAREEMKDLVRAYNTEAKWFIEGYLPRFDEYMGNALVTSTYFALATTSFLGMAEVATKEAYDWLRTKPKSLMACVTICRLMDDIETYEGRGQIATGIECYMKEHDVSKEEAMTEFKQRAEDAWKDLNKELMKPTSVSEHLLMPIMNLARLIDVTYGHSADGYTHPEKILKAHILKLLVNPVDV
ncbi:hypothetical protein RJ640_000258 [Escallonia rubra]|uniref:Uncharacterized protein n=1 Tax=Escallonia rubra TaxID=112253 RepID=A0AA88RPQ8_9ASTE|nr:hypothetical protein RJ640_000258 [Escallonia rubra]